MIIWLNGAYGSGKTTCAYELKRRLDDAFVYDPENMGYFIRANIPASLHKPDFQDHEQWRSFNYEMLRYLSASCDSTIIVPMTILKPEYYDEIADRLIRDGFQLKHYILYAERRTLEKRLSKRLEHGDTWAKANIDRCIRAFNSCITEEKIITDGKSVDAIVSEIAANSGLTLAVDSRGRLRKLWDRQVVLFRHIR